MRSKGQKLPPDIKMPFVMLEVEVIEKTGWTFDELDRQDTDRVLRMMEVIGKRDSIIHSQSGKKG